MSDSESILFRFAGNLFSRSHSIRSYFGAIGPGESSEHLHFGAPICTSLDAIEKTIIANVRAVRKARKKRENNNQLYSDALKNLLFALRSFTSSIAELHELLVYLPRLPASPEAVFLLKMAFGDYFAKQSPTIILGSVFNALEYDFYLKIKQRIVTLDKILTKELTSVILELPICDRNSPTTWPILAHELGHTLDREYNISAEVAILVTKDPVYYSRIQKWCKEVCADFIAAKVLGPAPVLALFGLDLCFLSYVPAFFAPRVHLTHPTTRWRLLVVQQYLRQKPRIGFLEEMVQLAEEIYGFSVKDHSSSNEEAQKIHRRDDQFFQRFMLEIADRTARAVQSIPLPEFDVVSDDSLRRCNFRLDRGLPVGSQGLPRDVLVPRIEEYKKDIPPEGPERSKKFQQLVAMFAEQPTPIPVLLLSGLIRRERILTQYRSDKDCFCTIESVRNYTREIARLDELLVGSIKGASVHKYINAVIARQYP